MTLIGKHDNALANLRAAAEAGRKHGALGYLITDWGDGGHPQPLAVSYLPYLAGAALAWCATSFQEKPPRQADAPCADEPASFCSADWQSAVSRIGNPQAPLVPNAPPTASRRHGRLPTCATEHRFMEKQLVSVLSRDIFHDPTGRIARAALELGLAHRKFRHTEPNSTPFGTVIAAPPPELRELFCRNGLKLYSRIAGGDIRAALAEVERLQKELRRARPQNRAGKILQTELELAARMAAQSCQFMLWQQALAAGESARARRMAAAAIRALRKLEKDFDAHWPLRNKGTTHKCSAFLRWRMYSMHPHI
jgi:hypothetical protein